MTENLEIRGGATQFEAAVIAVVLDQIERDEQAAVQRRTSQAPSLPAWVRVVRGEETGHLVDVPRQAWRNA